MTKKVLTVKEKVVAKKKTPTKRTFKPNLFESLFNAGYTIATIDPNTGEEVQVIPWK